MRKAIKKRGKIVQAYRLDDNQHPVIKKLIDEGKVKVMPDGTYQIFSQEAINGDGQVVSSKQYYIRIDSTGAPYPNSAEYVKRNLKHIQGDDYEQVPKPVNVWHFGDEMCEELDFLVQHKGLIIDEKSNDKYYTAPLWGTKLSAGKNAYIVFYKISRDEKSNILDVDFNFVESNEFMKTYSWC